MATIDQVSSTANAPDAVNSPLVISKRKRPTDDTDQIASNAEDEPEQSQSGSRGGSDSLYAFLIDVHDILKWYVQPLISFHQAVDSSFQIIRLHALYSC